MEKFSQLIFKVPFNLFPAFFGSVFFMFLSCSPNENDSSFLNEISSSDAKATIEPGTPEMLVSGLQGASGSTIGPDGALYVVEGAIGEITRIDLDTGEMSNFASGLPPSLVGLGGAIDLVFLDETAYALVTLVGSQFGGESQVGIYRIDGPNSHTVIADIGQFALDNLPSGFDYFVEMGLQYSIEVFRSGFLVTDGHHNRLLYVAKKGDISIFKQFGNIVPTGLDVIGHTIYMAEAGPAPHLPDEGKIIALDFRSSEETIIATGARLLVDVERGLGRTLFGLSQGEWNQEAEGSPALPNTGSLVKVDNVGSFSVVAEELNLPTSLEIVGNTAYIVTLTGEVWVIENISSPPFGI